MISLRFFARHAAKADADREARPSGPRVQFQRRTMGIRDRLDDSHPEPAAGRRGAGSAVETVEDARPLFRWNTRSVVHDFEQCLPTVSPVLYRHIHAPAGGS